MKCRIQLTKKEYQSKEKIKTKNRKEKEKIKEIT